MEKSGFRLAGNPYFSMINFVDGAEQDRLRDLRQ